MTRESPREKALRSVRVGDIFYALTRQDKAPLICLTTEVTETTICGRTVTQGYDFTFDRRTGEGSGFAGATRATILSVEKVPAEIHEALLSLDRKRLNWDGPLSVAQKRALVFIADFYPAHPLDAA
jgi:hypothetical protein